MLESLIGNSEASLEFLTKQITYEVPEQDLTYNLIRIPSLPKKWFYHKSRETIKLMKETIEFPRGLFPI